MCRRYGSRPLTAYVRSCKRKTSIPYRVPLSMAERLGWEAGRCIPIPPASIRQRGAVPGESLDELRPDRLVNPILARGTKLVDPPSTRDSAKGGAEDRRPIRPDHEILLLPCRECAEPARDEVCDRCKPVFLERHQAEQLTIPEPGA